MRLTDSRGLEIVSDELFSDARITPEQLEEICPDDYPGYRAAILTLLKSCREFYASPKSQRKHHSVTFVNLNGFTEEELND